MLGDFPQLCTLFEKGKLKIFIMKKIAIHFLAIVLLAASCGSDPSATQPGDDKKNEAAMAPAADPSAVMAQIDTMAFTVDQAINHTNLERYFPFIHSKKDGVFFYKPNGEAKRMTCAIYEADVESRGYYYLEGSEVVFHRKREWHFNGNPPFAKEFISYMKNGKTINAQERKVALAPGEKPTPLMGQSFYPAKVDMDSLYKTIHEDYIFLKNPADTCKVQIMPQ